jgi:hypothetical protein
MRSLWWIFRVAVAGLAGAGGFIFAAVGTSALLEQLGVRGDATALPALLAGLCGWVCVALLADGLLQKAHRRLFGFEVDPDEPPGFPVILITKDMVKQRESDQNPSQANPGQLHRQQSGQRHS